LGAKCKRAERSSKAYVPTCVEIGGIRCAIPPYDLLYLSCLVALVLGGSGPFAVDGWLLRKSRAWLGRA
jgi:hypothetical protein